MTDKEVWESHADRCLAKITGGTPTDIMLRASFEHSKTWFQMEPFEDDEWLAVCRGEVEAMIEALRQNGYALIATHSQDNGAQNVIRTIRHCCCLSGRRCRYVRNAHSDACHSRASTCSLGGMAGEPRAA